jgi:hypothetical protein
MQTAHTKSQTNVPRWLNPRGRVAPAADVSDVMREQLEYLIAHTDSGFCGCDDCERYLRVEGNPDGWCSKIAMRATELKKNTGLA